VVGPGVVVGVVDASGVVTGGSVGAGVVTGAGVGDGGVVGVVEIGAAVVVGSTGRVVSRPWAKVNASLSTGHSPMAFVDMMVARVGVLAWSRLGEPSATKNRAPSLLNVRPCIQKTKNESGYSLNS
jgi:hypothetical protein